MDSSTGQVIDLGSLYHRFEVLKDKRKAKGKRYALATILVGMFLAKLCGEDKPSGIAEWVALRGEWIVKVLGLKRTSMPSHHTYRRVGTLGSRSASPLWGGRLSGGCLHGWQDVARNHRPECE